MKCPVCIEEGQRSSVTDRGGTTTLAYYAPFYDEDGRRHHHDGNIMTSGYLCSRGHRFSVSQHGSCWCGWGKDQVPRVSVVTPPPEGSVEAPGSERVITDKAVLKAMSAVVVYDDRS